MAEETASPSFHYWDTIFVKLDSRTTNMTSDARDLLFQPLRIRRRFGSPSYQLQTPTHVKTRDKMSENLRIYLPMIWETPFVFFFFKLLLFSREGLHIAIRISNPPAPTSRYWDYSHHNWFDVLWIKPRALDTVGKHPTNSTASSDCCWVCWSIWDCSPTKVRRNKMRQICASIKTIHYTKKLYKSRGSWRGLPKSEVLFWPLFILVNHLLSAFIRVSEYPYLVLTCSQTVSFSRAETEHLFLL